MLQRAPGTLLDFAAWLETKNPTEKYDWTRWESCACAQYFRERGCLFEEWQLNSQRYTHLNELARSVTKRNPTFWERLCGWRSDVGTFGDLLSVVRKELNA